MPHKRKKTFFHYITNERGATSIEYAVLAAMVAIGCIAGWTALRDSTTGMFERVETAVESVD